MGRRKRAFTNAVAKAEKRLSGLKAIDPQLDLGNGLSVTEFETILAAIKTQITVFNTAMSGLDQQTNDINAALKALSEFNRRILAAVGAAFGYDSNEYEMVGGTRVSDIKRGPKSSTDDSNNDEEE
ncbi:MAG: hypothetical protein HUJ25_05675 [Crocinitomicaceae bacterium]|nr:hypothetical protein [Crocinitomicaceae bacterium]